MGPTPVHRPDSNVIVSITSSTISAYSLGSLADATAGRTMFEISNRWPPPSRQPKRGVGGRFVSIVSASPISVLGSQVVSAASVSTNDFAGRPPTGASGTGPASFPTRLVSAATRSSTDEPRGVVVGTLGAPHGSGYTSE